MLGLFTEMGPLTLNDFSFASAAGGVPRVFDTAKSWHKLPANLLFIEHPAPTGLSYCDGGSCKWDDFSQAEVSYKVLKQFFQLYPEFAANPFFMTGESYAGVLGMSGEKIRERRNYTCLMRARLALCSCLLIAYNTS